MTFMQLELSSVSVWLVVNICNSNDGIGGTSSFHICSDAATGRLRHVAMSTPIPTTVHTWWASFHMIWSLVMTLSTMRVQSAVHP